MTTTTTSPEPTPTPPPSLVYHRGDPIDAQLIETYLIDRILFPRIINAIRWVSPQLYLDLSVGVVNDSSNNGTLVHISNERQSSVTNIFKDPLFVKRCVEVILRASMLLGSIYHNKQFFADGTLTSSVSIQTPAMQNFGILLRPTCNSNTHFDRPTRSSHNARKWNFDSIRSQFSMFCKVLALLSTVFIAPKLYNEMKYNRQQQLRWNETQTRPASSQNPENNQQRHIDHPQQPSKASVIDRRAKDRQSYCKTLFVDTTLGTAEIFIPPLRLANFVLYLWGMSSNPDLGMRLSGWEYASTSNSSTSQIYSYLDPSHHRHANFHYGNRRLFVEELLRTISRVLPSSGNEILQPTQINRSVSFREDGTLNRSERSQGISIDAQIGSPNRVERNYHTRRNWLRQRLLSFVGIAEENFDKESSQKCTLVCCKCGSNHPSIPYITSCGHCYCYICLRTSILDDLHYRCATCGRTIETSCRADFTKEGRFSYNSN